MAINLSLPWGGATGHGGGYTALQWQQMQQQLIAPVDGILRGFDADLIVEESTPNALTVRIAPGSAIVQGIYVTNNDYVTVTIEANASGNPRIDGLALQVDWATQIASFVAVKGTPAASPVAPSMTQTSGTLWQMLLANVAVADSATTISNSDITDLRTFADLPQNKDMNPPTVQATGVAEITVTAGVKSVLYPVYIRETTLDMATAGDWLDGVTNESASAFFYVYVNQDGEVKIHDAAPTYADFWQATSGDLIFYHDGTEWWRLLGKVYNGSGSDLDTDFPATIDGNITTPIVVDAVDTAGHSTTSTSNVDISAALSVTITTNGNPITVGFNTNARGNGGYSAAWLEIAVDGVSISSPSGGIVGHNPVSSNFQYELMRGGFAFPIVLTPGSHTISIQWRVSGDTMNMSSYSRMTLLELPLIGA